VPRESLTHRSSGDPIQEDRVKSRHASGGLIQDSKVVDAFTFCIGSPNTSGRVGQWVNAAAVPNVLARERVKRLGRASRPIGSENIRRQPWSLILRFRNG
jgi:hypothetical protein